MTFKDARNLILLFRFKSYVKTAFILLEELQSQDIHIKTLVCNIIAKKTLSIILMICAIIMLLIKDCIQDIMILKDDIFKKMFHADWINIIAFKTLNFHNLFILLSSTLNFFILLFFIVNILDFNNQVIYTVENIYMNIFINYYLILRQKAVLLNLDWMKLKDMIAENKYFKKEFTTAEFLMLIW